MASKFIKGKKLIITGIAVFLALAVTIVSVFILPSFFEDDDDLNKIRETPNNDYGNALLFIYCFGDYVCYVKEENSWCTYNRGYWQIKSDDKFNVAQKCLTMYERFGIAVKSLSDADVSKRRHLALGNQRTIKNLIEQLKLLVNTSANMFEKNKELQDVSILDIAPTIASIMGFEREKEWEGKTVSQN